MLLSPQAAHLPNHLEIFIKPLETDTSVSILKHLDKQIILDYQLFCKYTVKVKKVVNLSKQI